MKKLIAFLLALVTLFSLAACGGAPAATEEPEPEAEEPVAEEPEEGGVELPAEDVAMQYMTADETLAILGQDGYTVIDLRKAEDYDASHIPGSVLLSMDPAVNGDTDDGIATMKAGVEGVDDTLVLVCYSGKKYAQMGTNILSALGYDMTKVYTLEGGFNNWSEVNPDSVESAAAAEEAPVELPAEDVAMQYMTADETLAILGQDGYTVIDLRKAEDYDASHIPGSVLLSMDPAVNGDTDDGIATMKAGVEGVDDTLVLVCYSGKKYAQMGTNILSALGYDMTKVYTLEGGFNNWIEVNPDSVEPAAE